MAQPAVAVLVSSFERPAHLRRALASIAEQRGVRGGLEVVVTDDGSRDETPRLVREFAASVSFPVKFTTHPHDGFQLARCRNEGVRASDADYLVFLDGDCIIPPDHLRIHLDRRRANTVQAGYFARLDKLTSDAISIEEIRRGNFTRWLTWSERWQLMRRHFKSAFYSLIRDPTRPKLFGNNIGIARADYERVNGYDENFRGWGCEDDDLRLRLRAAGVQIESILRWTHVYHLWHPKAPSAPAIWREGANVAYLQRPVRLTQCLAGLQKRRLQDLHVRLIGRRPPRETLDRTLPLWCRVALSARRDPAQPPEIELAFTPSSETFSPQCGCRVLIVPKGQTPARELVRESHLVFAGGEMAGAPQGKVLALESLEAILERQLGLPRVAAPASRRLAHAA